ncbi:MAG TPA: YceD family protein [Candidatus Angelobacter sp.]|jgi:uncharacterized metal-binding protein YceD (DUF177 family)|nr:YceD family protein [Candidatus Angelobacter sp.]
MPIVVNLRHLEENEVHLKGELAAAELALDVRDELIRIDKPLRYDMTVEQLNDAVLVQGKLELTLDCECARCLRPFEHEMALTHWALHLPLEGEDKVSQINDSIDLTPFVREDILLEFPQHPLCRSNCSGLKKKSGVDGVGDDEKPPSAWTELDKLKL